MFLCILATLRCLLVVSPFVKTFEVNDLGSVFGCSILSRCGPKSSFGMSRGPFPKGETYVDGQVSYEIRVRGTKEVDLSVSLCGGVG